MDLLLAMKLFCCVIVLFASQALSESECELTVKDKNYPQGVKYDLSSLITFRGTPYSVKDIRTIGTTKPVHTYYFDFCKNIAAPQESCRQTHGTINGRGDPAPTTKCNKLSRGKPDSCEATVFQVFDKDTCLRAGGKLGKNVMPNATFFDPKDPSKGVKIIYGGGDQCGVDKNGKARPRMFMINVMCDPDDHGINIPDDEPIIENPVCEYTLTLKSKYGCPTSCGSVGGNTCNDHGECGMDARTQEVRCFCNRGWYGSTCSDKTVWMPVHKGTLVFLSVLAVLLMGAVGTFTVLVWRRVKGLRLDPEAYSSMGGDNMTMKTEDMDSVDEDDEEGGKDDDI